MENIVKLLCEKNKISYIIFDKELKILDFNTTLKNISDDANSLVGGGDIREVLWEIIGLEDTLKNLYNGLIENDILHFPMILKGEYYYNLEIETFLTSSGEKHFITYAIQKQKESLAYLKMIQGINKKTLVYESQNKQSKEEHFELINQKLLSFNVDMNGYITSVNDAFLLFFDKPNNQIVTKHFSNFFRTRDDYLSGDATVIFHAVNIKGEEVSFHANVIPIFRDEVIYENIIMCQDITYLKQVEKELEFAASHDSLTGLPNRSYLLKKIDEAIQKHKQKKGNFSLCFIDLNKFKPVNDTYGHHAGDMLLKHIGKILSKFIRKDDLVARVGGDEFIILFDSMFTDEEKKSMKKKLLELAEKYPLVYSQEDIIEFSFSLGIVTYTDEIEDALSLIKSADKEMYLHKQTK